MSLFAPYIHKLRKRGRLRMRALALSTVVAVGTEVTRPVWSDSTAWVGIRWLASGQVPASAWDPATTDLLARISQSSWAFVAQRSLGLVDSIALVPLPRELMDPLTVGLYAAPHDRVYLRWSQHSPRRDAMVDEIDGVPVGTFQVYLHELVHASQARDPELWLTVFEGVSRQKDLRKYGALNRLEQQADAASWALTTLILERRGNWQRHPIADMSREMPGVRRMLGIFLRHPVFATQLDSLGRWRADSTVWPGDSALAWRMFRPTPNTAWTRGLAMLGLQQDDPRWWRWMQVVGAGPEVAPPAPREAPE
jgi:hypothetical protein